MAMINEKDIIDELIDVYLANKKISSKKDPYFKMYIYEKVVNQARKLVYEEVYKEVASRNEQDQEKKEIETAINYIKDIVYIGVLLSIIVGLLVSGVYSIFELMFDTNNFYILLGFVFMAAAVLALAVIFVFKVKITDVLYKFYQNRK